MTRDRWGASKFVRGQLRCAAENSYDATAEPTDADWATTCATMARKARNTFFFDMLSKTLPQNLTRANTHAILKRSSVCVNTPTMVYARLAGVDSAVTRVLKTSHYITEQAGAILYKYIEQGIKRDEAEFADLRDKQLRFVRGLLRKPALPPPVPSAVVVKRELEAESGGGESRESDRSSSLRQRVLWAVQFGTMPGPGGCIDLCDEDDDAPPARDPAAQEMDALGVEEEMSMQLGFGLDLDSEGSSD